MTNNNTSKNCFTPKNFQELNDIIDFQINVSGMGKFYVTFPEEKERINDGIKRPAKNSDHVYDVYKDTEVIHLKSPKHHFQFTGKNGLKDRAAVNAAIADQLFCYLLKK